jgi:hypothetical protein
MAEDSNGNIDYGANIAGLGLLLNAEKISNTVDLDDMEKKIKNMYNNELEEEEDEEEEEVNIEQEFEEAMEEARTVIDGGDDEEEEEDDEFNDSVSVANKPVFYTPSPYNQDGLYVQKTKEEQLQSDINNVMKSVPNIDMNIDQEVEEERKNSLLEQIESLKDDLDELGVNTDRIPPVSYTSSLKQITEVHNRLMFKYNKLKYNSIAEETLVAGASILEMMFNGKHEYFGTKPDITGYSDVVKSKLKRIRFETSTTVSRFVTNNNIGLIPRILMELVPSLITQSQRRRLQTNDTLNASMNNNVSIRNHLTDLNNL